MNQGFFLDSELARYQQQFMRNLLQETIGFAGCKIARRQWGVAGVADIRGIQDEATATHAETLAIAIAREFVVHYRDYNQIQDIFNVLHQHAHKVSSAMVQL